ncbi:PASTA domain-containing protein [Actinomadura sp. DC4]|uniref:PASTA domain-containing protein n=1 Tax=Actinomadura sp. DC4 TaxID=3055069 RepID=UPI0025B0D484|nr:PASTA domain-containing protein [Actinomadura sp. DC4]MDN3356302.1 PASTA domain-containing protein [Actinomadura sp. DC4]
MRTMRTIALTTLAALALTGCGAAAPSSPQASTPARPRVRLIKVPAVVGRNHQLAQNTMQAAGLYNLREKDATGRGRLLIWDRNWVVVRQSPPAGRRVRPDTVITLYSKKIGE